MSDPARGATTEDAPVLDVPWHLGVLRRLVRTAYRLQGTGLPSLAEVVRGLVARRYAGRGDVLIRDFQGRLRFVCDLDEHMGSQIFFRGAYSGDLLRVVARLIREDSTFVDAGANQGEFTVHAAAIATGGVVHAFEPLAVARRRLARNVRLNELDNVRIHPCGLGDETRDDVPIFVADGRFDDGTTNVGLGSLYEAPGRSTAAETIRIVRLDDVLRDRPAPVDLIKIDVEGAELAVLRGACEIVEKDRPAVLFEANEEAYAAAGYRVRDVRAWFEAAGYGLRVVESGGVLADLERLPGFGNLLAEPRVPGVSRR